MNSGRQRNDAANNETFDGSASAVTAFRLTPGAPPTRIASGTAGRLGFDSFQLRRTVRAHWIALGLERMSRVSTGGGSCCHLSVHPDATHIGV
eukprot:SAG31_NODE_22962_length_514_cov_0.913253_1_plen_92_part_01